MFSANIVSASIGSEPGDKIKINGIRELDSANDLEMSKGGGNTNFKPIPASTNRCI